ncbi:MAG: FliH/SctL family protein [Deltaproteobacteria bacterium]|nr:FliH/SctL family protein [Deltaproteobacteria bacterium]
MSKVIKNGEIGREVGLVGAVDLEASGTSSLKDDLLQFGSVLKNGVLESQSQGEKILATAKVEAMRIKGQVEAVLAQAEQTYESEKKRGFEEGVQEGLAQMTETLVKAEAEREKMLSQSEEEIVTLVNAIVHKVLGREIERGAVVDVARQAVSQIVGQRIVIRVHPSDLKFLRQREKELMSLLDRTQSLNFREDPLIAEGGCVVDSELGTIDAQLPYQLSAIKKALGL